MFRVPKIRRVDLRLTPMVRMDTTTEQTGRVAKIDDFKFDTVYGSSAVTINMPVYIKMYLGTGKSRVVSLHPTLGAPQTNCLRNNDPPIRTHFSSVIRLSTTV